MSTGVIKKVAGPLVIAEGMRDANMFDVVRVSKQRLIGEIIEMHGDEASIQVYEETSGLGPGEPVESMDVSMSVELGPGLITSIYDGIQRPLDDIMKISGNNLKRGVEVPSLKRDLKWGLFQLQKLEMKWKQEISSVQYRRQYWFSRRSWYLMESKVRSKRSRPVNLQWKRQWQLSVQKMETRS